MRAILAITLGLALAWGGYWFWGAHQARLLAGAWMAQNQVQGKMTLAGFPNRFDLTVTGVTAQGDGFGYAADFIQILTMSWKPWHLIIALAPRQDITLAGQELRLATTRLLASLELAPFGGTALGDLRVDGTDLRLAKASEPWITAEHMTLGIESGTDAKSPRFGGHLRGITPSLAVAGLPKMIKSLSIEGHLELDHPLDSAKPPPNLLALDVTRARLIWGDLDLSITGHLAPDGMGYVSGDLVVTVQGAQDLPPILVALGLVSDDQGAQLARGLALTGTGEFTLRLSDGMIQIGPIPLGPAPLWPV